MPPTLGRAGGSRMDPPGHKVPIAVGSHAGQDWSSKEGHRADALALRADERRDKLR